MKEFYEVSITGSKKLRSKVMISTVVELGMVEHDVLSRIISELLKSYDHIGPEEEQTEFKRMGVITFVIKDSETDGYWNTVDIRYTYVNEVFDELVIFETLDAFAHEPSKL